MVLLARRCALILLASLQFAASAQPAGPTEIERAREDLGIGKFKAPSIEDVFEQLSTLQPIPFDKIWRTPPEHLPQDRPRIALLAGDLIADGFLIVVEERASKVEPVGRELVRLAKGLGIGERMTKRGRHVVEMADHENWPEIRKELVKTQAEAEAALLKLKDDDIVQLIALGGWLRGLEITSATIGDDYTPERAAHIFKPELADAFLDRIHLFHPRLRNSSLMLAVEKDLRAIKEIALAHEPDRPYSAAEVKRIRDLTRDADKVIAGNG